MSEKKELACVLAFKNFRKAPLLTTVVMEGFLLVEFWLDGEPASGKGLYAGPTTSAAVIISEGGVIMCRAGVLVEVAGSRVSDRLRTKKENR
ncbi:hypothetical protein AVEN_159491-1 [Araneus ventricosus]|uniref:Uncharacterized protein n=1 Tax=Araneus ventricosus TaxID=182803 RepID=A0A4Y2A128_ARAVE|nr:hypothetical protein AVEN_159491-1 [Araneus ventricosus]